MKIHGDKLQMKEKRKWSLHYFWGQVNSNSMKSKGEINGQGGQKCEERSKVVKFIL